MGLIKWFKRIFKKTISLKDINSNYLVALEKSNEKIKFGTMLEVAPNFVCAMVYKNKVADIFTEGRYRLDTSIIPLLSRMQKLTKPNKKGNLPKYFKVNVYYINLKVFENAIFQSFDEIAIKDKNYKRATCKLGGQFSYQITSPVDFMEAMFMRYGVLRDGVAKNELSSWVAEISTKIVQKRNLTVEKLFMRDSSCFDNITEKLNKELFDVGVKILSFEVTDVIFPKKLYKKITLDFKEINKNQQDDLNEPVEISLSTSIEPNIIKPIVNVETITESVNFEQNVETKNNSNSNILSSTSQNYDKAEENIIQDSTITNQHNNIDETNLEYSNSDTENIDTANLDQKATNQTNYQNIEFDEIEFASKQVDNAPIQKTIEYKKCSNCGAFNSSSAEICFSCGHHFD